MALIYRSIFSAPLDDGTTAVATEAESWLASKVEGFEPGAGIESFDVPGYEVRVASVRGDGGWPVAVRYVLFENPESAGGQEVRTTVTAWQLAEGSATSVWVDVHRWLAKVEAHVWVPSAPRVVRSILGHAEAEGVDYGLSGEFATVGRDEAEPFLDVLLHPDRQHPVMVVTRDPRVNEAWDDVADRARTLQQSVAGIARVIAFDEGAATEFSRATHARLGALYDVHSGAIRTYLPGLGQSGDWPYRHPFVQGRRVVGRPRDVLRTIVAGPMHRRAAEVSPPREWRSTIRPLMRSTESDEELAAMLESENDALHERVRAMSKAQETLLEENTSYLRNVDYLARRVAYLEKLNPEGASLADTEVVDDIGELDFPSDVVTRVRERLPYVVMPDHIDESAAELDDMAEDATWAAKSWRAFSALNSYAAAKSAGTFRGGLIEFMDRGEGDVIPRLWVAMHESETTETNRRYSRLRTLPISTEVDPSGKQFMGAHIKIQQGGSPCPRIHFVDDTAGVTGKIHIGWFGDHLDNASKS